jgi:hypothetical protein
LPISLSWFPILGEINRNQVKARNNTHQGLEVWLRHSVPAKQSGRPEFKTQVLPKRKNIRQA